MARRCGRPGAGRIVENSCTVITSPPPAFCRETWRDKAGRPTAAPNPTCVLLCHRKDDGLSRKRTALIFDADVHDLFPLPAQCIAIGDEYLKVGARVVNRIRVKTLLNERISILF